MTVDKAPGDPADVTQCPVRCLLRSQANLSVSQYKVMKSCPGNRGCRDCPCEVSAGRGAGQGAEDPRPAPPLPGWWPEAGPASSQGFRVSSATGGLGEMSTGVSPSSHLMGVASIEK